MPTTVQSLQVEASTALSPMDSNSVFVHSEYGPRYSDWTRVGGAAERAVGLDAALDEGSLHDVYRRYDEEECWYRPDCFQTLEVDVPPEYATDDQEKQDLSPRFRDVPYRELSSWLAKVKHEVDTAPEPGKPQPRLRLLISPRYRAQRLMPMSCPEMVEDLAECLNIPPTFPCYDNQAETHAMGVDYSSESDKDNDTGIRRMVIKTAVGLYPSSYDQVYFLALGYNPVTSSLTGLLVKQQPAAVLLDDISSCVRYSSHPILIAFLLFRNLVEVSDDVMGELQHSLRGVQMAHRHLTNARDHLTTARRVTRRAVSGKGPDMDSDTSNAELTARPRELLRNQVRGQLRGQLKNMDSDMSKLYSSLESEQFESISGLMATLDECFHRLRSRPEARPDLLAIFEQYKIVSHNARSMLRRRECSTRELQFQVQMVYHTLQRQTAALAREDTVIALRDSSQMKAVAVLTMVFLPTTALATIFSMSPFFTTDDGGRVTVTTEFWLFFVVTVPVTILVVIIYVAWIQRREFADKWATVMAQSQLHEDDRARPKTMQKVRNIMKRRKPRRDSRRSVSSVYRDRRHDVSSLSDRGITGSPPNELHDVSPPSPMSGSSSNVRRRHDVSLSDSAVALEEGLRRSNDEI